jgi:hypothetical protein
MIFFYSICGVGVVAVGLAISELFGRKSGRSVLRGKRITTERPQAMVAPYYGGEVIPPPRDLPPQ